MEEDIAGEILPTTEQFTDDIKKSSNGHAVDDNASSCSATIVPVSDSI